MNTSITRSTTHEEKENVQEVYMGKIIDDKGNNTKKRGPGTPITPSLQQSVIRRKVELPKCYLTFDNDDIKTIEYENWLIQQKLAKNHQLRDFLQLETKFQDPRT